MAPYSVGGYGLPSGHTQAATTVASTLVAETRKRWTIILLVLYMFLTGISRMIHGVHFPQDVLMGWFLGIAIVIILLKLEAVFGQFLSDITFGQTILITVIVAGVLLGLSFWSASDVLSTAAQFIFTISSSLTFDPGVITIFSFILTLACEMISSHFLLEAIPHLAI